MNKQLFIPYDVGEQCVVDFDALYLTYATPKAIGTVKEILRTKRPVWEHHQSKMVCKTCLVIELLGGSSLAVDEDQWHALSDLV